MIPFVAGFALGILATVAAVIFVAVALAMFMDEEARK